MPEVIKPALNTTGNFTVSNITNATNVTAWNATLSNGNNGKHGGRHSRDGKNLTSLQIFMPPPIVALAFGFIHWRMLYNGWSDGDALSGSIKLEDLPPLPRFIRKRIRSVCYFLFTALLIFMASAFARCPATLISFVYLCFFVAVFWFPLVMADEETDRLEVHVSRFSYILAIFSGIIMIAQYILVFAKSFASFPEFQWLLQGIESFATVEEINAKSGLHYIYTQEIQTRSTYFEVERFPGLLEFFTEHAIVIVISTFISHYICREPEKEGEDEEEGATK